MSSAVHWSLKLEVKSEVWGPIRGEHRIEHKARDLALGFRGHELEFQR